LAGRQHWQQDPAVAPKIHFQIRASLHAASIKEVKLEAIDEFSFVNGFAFAYRCLARLK